MNEEDIAELARLEQGLWQAETRQSPAWMDDVLAADFIEFGASGRIHTREATLRPAEGSLYVELPLPDFSVRSLGRDAALVTYLSVQHADGAEDRRAWRASVWRREGGAWKLAFHQGTLLGSEPEALPDRRR